MFLKEKQAFKYPFKTDKKEIPIADIAENQTTIDLVQEHEPDARFFRELEKDKIFLNENQLKAVRAKNGPHLVLAGAGSGKTRVLTCRTAYLLTYVEDLKPEEIMLVTFTRKAANEMLDRMKKFKSITSEMAERIVSGTFHSIFLKLLRSSGYNQEILSNEKYKEILIKQILREMGIKDAYDPETILSTISSFKSQMLFPQHIRTSTPVEKEVKEIYRRYEKLKESKNQMDFDDILLFSFQLLQSNSELRISLQNRFKYISVDEYQDTNIIQHELIKMILNPRYDNLFVVGDSDQTIYSFRNADVGIILNLEAEFPNMTQIILDTNYRSNANIVGLGNEVIKYNKKRYKKTLNAYTQSETPPLYLRPYNSDDEARMIVDNIVAEVKQGNREYKDHAILYRTHSLSRAVFDELVARDIPFIVHGNNQPFYLNSIVKPILDHMRLAIDPNNLDAIAGICPSMYLNKDKVGLHVTSNALSQKKDYLALLLRMPGLKPYHQGQILNRIEYIRSLKEMVPKKAIEFIRKGPIKYEAYLELDERKTLTLHKEVIQETLDELEAASEKFSSVEEFIRFVDKIIAKHKEMDRLKKNPNANAIHLITLHSAKGLEYPVVFILGVVDGVLPHKSAENANEQKDRISTGIGKDKTEIAIEEERRLFYVGITRAEEELYLSSPKKHRGKDVEISKFLLETFNQPFQK